MEHAVKPGSVDRGLVGAGTVDRQVVGDVQITGGGNVFIRAGNAQGIGAGPKSDHVVNFGLSVGFHNR